MSFSDFLREHRSGQTHDSISAKLQELVDTVVEQDRAGSLTIKISLKPRGRGDEGAYDVTVDTTLSLPKPPPLQSILYATPDGNLVRANPHQQDLDLREIPAASPHRSLA
jgi:hypothetical protein